MSDQNVNIPESGTGDFASSEVRSRAGMGSKILLFLGFIMVVIIGLVFFSANQTIDPPSSVNVDTNLDSTPGGQNQAVSGQYQEILKGVNTKGADQAETEGRTFITTPEQILEDFDPLEVDTRIEDETKVAQQPAVPSPPEKPAPQVPPQPVAQAAQPPVAQPANAPSNNIGGEENPYVAAMIGQMSAISRPPPNSAIAIASTGVGRPDAGAGAGAGVGGIQTVPGVSGVSGIPGVAGAGVAGADVPLEDEFETVIIPAGEIVYAETLISTNSDLAGSPVLVELTTGEYRGSRLIGSFSVNESSNKMVLEFSTMTTPDRDTYEIEAFGVDGKTAEVALASGINRRYLPRYGPILAAAFLTSYALGLAAPEQTLTTVGDETAVVQKRRTERQSIYAGLGAATAAITADLARSAPRGPKILLRDGWPLGILFVSSVVKSDG